MAGTTGPARGAPTAAGAQDSALVVTPWTTEHGLPENNVNAIVQTRDGYLWLATWNGIARFDGERFVRFRLADGLRTTQVFRLLEDRAGDLWIGTFDGGLSRYRDGVIQTFGLTNGLPSESVSSLALDGDGALWAGLYPGLVRYDGQGFVDAVPAAAEEGARLSWSIFSAPDGGVWAVSARRDIWRWHSGEWTPQPAFPEALGMLGRLFFDRAGGVWASVVPGGVARLDTTGWRKVPTPDGPDSYVWSWLTRTDGSVVCGGFEGGVFQWRNGRFSPLGLDLPPVRDGVLALADDGEGNLWAGTRTLGLIRLRPRRVGPVAGTDGITVARSVTFDRRGRLWIGTDNGLHALMGGRLVQVATSGCKPVLARPAGGVWFARDPTDLWQLDPEADAEPRLVWRGTASGAEVAAGVWSLLDDGAGGLWFGTGTGQLGHLAGGQVTLHATTARLAGKKIVALVQEPGGALWLGSEGGGVHRWENGRVTDHLMMEEGLPINSVRAMHLDGAGTLWIATYGGGLARHREGRIFTFDATHGMPDEMISALVEDDAGHLWCAANPGLFRLDKAVLDDVAAGRAPDVHPLMVGRSDGLTTGEPLGGVTPGAVRGPDGRLYFPKVDGLFSLAPGEFSATNEPPRVLLKEVWVDGRRLRQRVGDGLEVRLPPGAEHVSIRYTAFFFSAPEALRFRHRLAGADTDWFAAGSRRVAEYRKLPPGRYEFEVTAASSPGRWNPRGPRLALTLTPFFWQTWWFRGAVATVLFGAAATGVLLRIRHLERMRRIQTAFSQRLLQSQESERQRIAAELHDSVGQNLLVIKNRADLGGHQAPADTSARHQLAEISQTAAGMLTELREITANLRPTLLDRLGLTRALREMAARVTQASGLTLTQDLEPLDKLIPPEAAIHLYRIAQECLNNVLKHSGATHATLRTQVTGGWVRLDLEDNGRGFDPGAGAGRGLGLNGITERARLLGGRVRLDSAPGRGTRWRIEIPAAVRPGHPAP